MYLWVLFFNKFSIYCIFFYFKRAFCAFCHDRIWGLGRQGFKCIQCKLLVHKKCHKLVQKPCTTDHGEPSNKERDVCIWKYILFSFNLICFILLLANIKWWDIIRSLTTSSWLSNGITRNVWFSSCWGITKFRGITWTRNTTAILFRWFWINSVNIFF